ncbi:MAG: hypothetical protein AB7I27_14420 [Bacteriovoracaceae bacterium]
MNIKMLFLLTTLTLSLSTAFAQSVEEALELAKQDGSAARAEMINQQRDAQNLNAISDTTLAETNISMIAPGSFTEDEERELIAAIKSGHLKSAEIVRSMNEIVTAALTGHPTDQSVNNAFFDYLQLLERMGAPQRVIDYQIEKLIAANERAARDQKLQEARQAIMNQFLSDLQAFGEKYRNGGANRPNMVIDLSQIFNAFYSIPEINAKLPGGNIQIIIK